jgi:ArsR family transcriptional regulator
MDHGPADSFRGRAGPSGRTLIGCRFYPSLAQFDISRIIEFVDTRQAVSALSALAQESRLTIFRCLVVAGPTGLSVGEIGTAVHVSPATLSFHLKELYHAGLVTTRQQGRYIYYSADYGQMNGLVGFLTENCCARDGVECAPACGPANRRARRDKSKA